MSAPRKTLLDQRDALAERYALLREYAQHEIGCGVHGLRDDGVTSCTCGLAALLTEEDK